MKNKLFILGILILLVLPSIIGEMTMFNQVIVNSNTQIVRYHGSYFFEDTSANSVGNLKGVPMDLFVQVQALPYTMTYGTVDYCNLTVTHEAGIYDPVTGRLINSTTLTTSYYYSSIPYTTQIVTVTMFASDYLLANMDCHYTDVRDLYSGNDLIGRFDTFIPTYQCAECTQYTLQQLTNEVEKGDNVTGAEIGIFYYVNEVVKYNFDFWLIVNWGWKIFLIGVCVFLVFYGFYYYYKLFKDMANI